jgi:transcriptional regulator with XRE-family HTH domain
VVPVRAAPRVPIQGGAAIGELRRLSGLTWEQLARLLDVSRRSLHFWASGHAMNASHEERLARVLAVVRKVDRGSSSANRALLLNAMEDGVIPVLLASDDAVALSRLGVGNFPRASPPGLSGAARAARAPRPPEELVGALHDRIQIQGGAARPARGVKVRSAV